MELIVYWGHLFIMFTVFCASWIGTSASILESTSIASVAYVSANILENWYRYFGKNKQARSVNVVNVVNVANVENTDIKLSSKNDKSD